MTANENSRLTKMEQSVEEIKTDISVIKTALIGNELSGDRGIIGQMNILKAEIDYLKKDLELVQKEAIENKVIIRQLKWVAGVSVAGLIGLMIKTIFTKWK